MKQLDTDELIRAKIYPEVADSQTVLSLFRPELIFQIFCVSVCVVCDWRFGETMWNLLLRFGDDFFIGPKKTVMNKVYSSTYTYLANG